MNWIAEVLGRDVTPKARLSVDEIPGAREFWADLADQQRARSYPGIDITESVVLRDDGDGRALTAEILRPADAAGSKGWVVNIHGGGWCLWEPAHVRPAAAAFARAGYHVLSLDYRLAPESPFPAAVEDTTFAIDWVMANGHEWGQDPDRIILTGDSAGANLSLVGALVVEALRSGRESELGLDILGSKAWMDKQRLATAPVTDLVLLYGVFDFPLLYAEPRTMSRTGVIETTWSSAYLGADFIARFSHPLVSPTRAPLLGDMPRMYLSCGANDALVPHTLQLASQATELGVDTTVSIVSGRDHEFLIMDTPKDVAEWERIIAWLAE